MTCWLDHVGQHSLTVVPELGLCSVQLSLRLIAEVDIMLPGVISTRR